MLFHLSNIFFKLTEQADSWLKNRSMTYAKTPVCDYCTHSIEEYWRRVIWIGVSLLKKEREGEKSGIKNIITQIIRKANQKKKKA